MFTTFHVVHARDDDANSSNYGDRRGEQLQRTRKSRDATSRVSSQKHQQPDCVAHSSPLSVPLSSVLPPSRVVSSLEPINSIESIESIEPLQNAQSITDVNMSPAQSYISSYSTRLARYGNAFYTPAVPTASTAPISRTTKRGTTIINYADDAFDDDDFDEAEGLRRPTGLRSLRREEAQNRDSANERLGKEIFRPVAVPGIFREWITRRPVKPTYDCSFINSWNPESDKLLPLTFPRTDQQVHIQSQLPLTLIPIRIDVDVPASQHDAPFPLTRGALEAGFHPGMPAFQKPEPSPAYKIRDIFLWNLHEALFTPDDFAQTLVRELDLPNPVALGVTISQQIRTQLEEYAGIAMHPLFHNQSKLGPPASALSTNGYPNPVNSRLPLGATTARPASTTPAATTPAQEPTKPLLNGIQVVAQASHMPAEPSSGPKTQDHNHHDHGDVDPSLNPDDTYRCIINLTIVLASRLYTDKFEWSLLHPPGFAEAFARQTAADLGLGGEWVLAITHAIHEAVLKLKKDACEGGMLGTKDLDNQAVRTEEGAGWRYDAERFGAEWAPRIETLSKDEIEKREGDRERQLRRVRRETAKFSSTAGMIPSMREQEAQSRASYFDPIGGVGAGDSETPNMGRGERSKKKRKFRSLSPTARITNSPAEGASGAGTGWGGADNKLQEYERQNWRCAWCLVWGTGVWAVRDGPAGARTLCNNCGLLYERDKKLPVWSEQLHKHDIPLGR